MKRLDLTGSEFGRLLVLEMDWSERKAKARCLCKCGSQTIVLAYNLRNGNTVSCGCVAREIAAQRGKRTAPVMGAANVKHGMSSTPTYASWLDARKRCFRPQNKSYPNYGGRGITMCERWAASFTAFLEDMGEAPAGHTIDRLNVDGNYEPGNCRWATKAEQARNRRSTVLDDDAVSQIRELHAAGASAAELARQFRTSTSNIEMVVRGKTWAT